MGVFLQRCTVSPVALDQPLARRACGGGAFRVRPTFRTVVGCSWPRLRAGDRKAPPTAYPCLCRRAVFVHDEVTELLAVLAQECSWLVEVATTLQALRRLGGGLDHAAQFAGRLQLVGLILYFDPRVLAQSRSGGGLVSRPV